MASSPDAQNRFTVAPETCTGNPAIWEAILARRTYALTGDRIDLAFVLNGRPMGAKVSPCKSRR